MDIKGAVAAILDGNLSNDRFTLQLFIESYPEVINCAQDCYLIMKRYPNFIKITVDDVFFLSSMYSDFCIERIINYSFYNFEKFIFVNLPYQYVKQNNEEYSKISEDLYQYINNISNDVRQMMIA
jgi:hypothetical protein